MKRLILILSCVIVTLTASAQLKFGLKGGINFTDLKIDNFNVKNRNGFFVGPTIKFKIPVLPLALDFAALYDQREAEINLYNEDNENIGTIKRQAINFPLNLRLGLGLGSSFELFVKAGPQVGFNVGGKSVLKAVQEWTWKSSEFSVNVGLGMTIAKHLEISANYNIVCGSSGETIYTIDGVKESMRNRSNAWQVGLGYYF
ncbi:MAG: porin family protein [Bacteroidaceae bacterium]|nr:porin family protein [Bacteroidaceae bacterium]